mmetsp:Transcript_3290/g.4795  ORF Transcript_3290/g.4795 Transcript_3290/m.4795 type:complete len:126 (-) Transcript_3290:301-678(-)
MCQTGTNQSQEQRLQWPTHMVSFSTIDLAHLKRQLAQHTVDSVVAVTEIIMNVSYLLFFNPSKIDFVLGEGDFECFSVFWKNTHARAISFLKMFKKDMATQRLCSRRGHHPFDFSVKPARVCVFF